MAHVEITTERLARELGRVTYRHTFVALLQNVNMVARAMEVRGEGGWAAAADWSSLEQELRGLFGEFEHLAGDSVQEEHRRMDLNRQGYEDNMSDRSPSHCTDPDYLSGWQRANVEKVAATSNQ